MNIPLNKFNIMIFGCLLSSSLQASEVLTPHVFSAGSPAIAEQVNDNFTQSQIAINDNNSRIVALESKIAELETKLASVSLLIIDGKPTVRFAGVNVQIVNGAGGTQTKNGTGNLIVGYDAPRSDSVSHCTLGTDQQPTPQPIIDQTQCYNAGGDWLVSFKNGSHNLVVGDQNNYSTYGGLVAGYRNTINNVYANISGGTNNHAGNRYASVSGGIGNAALGESASVTGGSSNIASGHYAHVSGGRLNDSKGLGSSISAGQSNIAGGDHASVSGGVGNSAWGFQTTISAGSNNLIQGYYGSISGGENNSVDGFASSISGGRSNYISGSYSSISGGGGTSVDRNIADTNYSSILGGIGNNTSSDGQTIP